MFALTEPAALKPRLAERPSSPALAVEFHYTQTDSFVALLQQLGASLLVSTYQANKLLVVRAAGGGLSTLVRTSTGRWAWPWMPGGWRLAPATRSGSCATPRTSPRASSRPASTTPAICRAPATSPATSASTSWPGPARSCGSSTRASRACVRCDPDYSFVPRWRPPFITALAAEDRCHLNGLAIVDGRPRYVTALGETDTAGGWRADKPQGGCLIDVTSGEIDQPRPVDAALAALARRPAVAAGIRDRAARARRSRHRPAADGGRAARLRPRPGAVPGRTPSSACRRFARRPRWTACPWPSGASS